MPNDLHCPSCGSRYLHVHRRADELGVVARCRTCLNSWCDGAPAARVPVRDLVRGMVVEVTGYLVAGPSVPPGRVPVTVLGVVDMVSLFGFRAGVDARVSFTDGAALETNQRWIATRHSG